MYNSGDPELVGPPRQTRREGGADVVESQLRPQMSENIRSENFAVKLNRKTAAQHKPGRELWNAQFQAEKVNVSAYFSISGVFFTSTWKILPWNFNNNKSDRGENKEGNHNWYQFSRNVKKKIPKQCT